MFLAYGDRPWDVGPTQAEPVIQGLLCWKRELEEDVRSGTAGSRFVAMREEPEKRANMAESGAIKQRERENGSC